MPGNILVASVDVTIEDGTALLAGDVVPLGDRRQFININDISAVASEFGQAALDCHSIGAPLLCDDFDWNNFINANDASAAATSFATSGPGPWIEPEGRALPQ